MTVCVCSLGLFLIAMDTTVVNLALPLIRGGLHAPVAGLQWTIAAYSITAASLMLSAGSIGDRFGRRTVLQAGLGLFTLASLGCGLAPGLGWLIAFRALQGVGGAALTPMSIGIITAAFADPAARTRAIGIWTGTWGIGMIAGPALGGVLAAAWGWRALFWVNVPPGLAGVVLAGLVIPDSRAARPRRADVPGQVLVAVFLACLIYGIIEGPALGWGSPAVLAAFAGSAAALALLPSWERRRAEPLIDLRVFRSVAFSGVLVITLCSFACLAGFLFLTTVYLQDMRGLTALRAGIALVPLAVAAAAAGPLAGRVMARHGARGCLAAGGAAFTLACLVLAQAPPAAPWALLTAAYAVFGAGYGAVNTVISAIAVAGMPRAQASVAGGISSAGRQAGQSLGVSAAGAVFASRLRGALPGGFAAASHPAWLVIAVCGFAVLPLGLFSTSRRAHPAGTAREPSGGHGDAAETVPGLAGRAGSARGYWPSWPASRPARWLALYAAVALAVTAWAGVSLATVKGSGSETVALSGRSTPTGTNMGTQAGTGYAGPGTLAGVLKAADTSVEGKGLLPPANCGQYRQNVDGAVVCTSPVAGVAEVSYQDYSSLAALYSAYQTQVAELDGGTFRQNTGTCGDSAVPYAEFGWNHEEGHPHDFTVAQMASGQIGQVFAAGRMACFATRTPHGVSQDIVWTIDNGPALAVAIGSGSPRAVYQLWASLHHVVLFRGTEMCGSAGRMNFRDIPTGNLKVVPVCPPGVQAVPASP